MKRTPPSPAVVQQALAHFEQAKALHARGDLRAAAEHYRQALARLPEHPAFLAAWGQLAEEAGDWNAAERTWRHLLSNPSLANIDAKLGNALLNLKRYDEAVASLEPYVQRNPRDADARRALALACFHAGRRADAYAHAKASWDVAPHPETLGILLSALLQDGDGDALGPWIGTALSRYPADRNLRKLAGEYLLKAGDFARAFPMMADMRASGGVDPRALPGHDIPAWDGQTFDGLLLVGAEQGLGDEILASSLFNALAARQPDVVIEADARLLPVFRRSFPSMHFVARDGQSLAGEIPADRPCRQCLAGDLWQFLFRDDASVTPWLQAYPARTAAIADEYRRRWPGTRTVGLSWHSARTLRSGASKGLPLSALLPLLRLPGVQCVSLQYGDIAPALAEAGPDAARMFIDPAIDTDRDIDGVFAQVAALDLVVTVSNLTAHIAGALGKPCIVLLPRRRPVIWYWGYAGESTRWYPSVRLWRNTHDTDFPPLVERLVTALSASNDTDFPA